MYPELFGLHLIIEGYDDLPFNGGLYHIKSHDIWLWQNELQEIPIHSKSVKLKPEKGTISAKMRRLKSKGHVK